MPRYEVLYRDITVRRAVVEAESAAEIRTAFIAQDGGLYGHITRESEDVAFFFGEQVEIRRVQEDE